jgi:hypothetical protein
MHLIIQGKPNPTKIANLFDAMAPHIAISANPLFFTNIILVTKSGKAEPTASNVIPATVSDIAI